MTPEIVGIVVPAYREADNIASLITTLRGILPDSLIVVVDDSPDLLTVAAARSTDLQGVTVVHRETKGGRGSAALDGMRLLLSQGATTIVEMDADFSHAPSEIPRLLRAKAERNLAMVIGSRYLPESRIDNWPLSRRLFSRLANVLARTLLGVPIRDYTNGFRVYALPAAQVVVATCGKIGKGFIPLSEVLVNLSTRGFRIGEVPTVFVNRARGESSLNVTEITNAFTGLFKIYFLKRRLQREFRSEVSA